MAMVAARCMLRSARVLRPAVPRTGGFAGALRIPVPSATVPAVSMRTYVTANKYTREETLDRLDNLYGEVLGANWADYLYLVYNGPFWETELEQVTRIVQPYLHEEEIGNKFAELQETFDVLYACEDVRDHLNELAELATRASGLMGTGYNAGEKVTNMDENAKACG